MKLVLNNPYRILGLLVGATAREQQSNKHKIKIYLDADQEIPNEIIWKEFNALGEILRLILSSIVLTQNSTMTATK